MKHFKIKEVKPKIFLFEFKDQYECGMHFLRYSEFYESSSPKFRGKSFEFFDYMKWYVKTLGRGKFTYFTDFVGFNIPGEVINTVHKNIIPDPNFYDQEMKKGYVECYNKLHFTKSFDDKFYIIGAVKNKSSTINHEIAHGKFYLDPTYKKLSTQLVKELPKKITDPFNKWLKIVGYTPKVFIDETQAYFSTGLPLTKFKIDQKYTEPFKKLFKQF